MMMTGRKTGVRRSRRRGNVTISGDETNTADSNIDSGRENEGFETGYSQAAIAAVGRLDDGDYTTDSEVEKLTQQTKCNSGHKNDTPTTNNDRPSNLPTYQKSSTETTEQDMRDRQLQVRQEMAMNQQESHEQREESQRSRFDENGNPTRGHTNRDSLMIFDTPEEENAQREEFERERAAARQTQIQRDSLIAAEMAAEEANRMEEIEREQAEERFRLPFTNKEMFEKREEIAKLLENASEPAHRAIARQLQQAIAEYQDVPSNSVTPISPRRPYIPGRLPANLKTRQVAQMEMNRTGRTKITAAEINAREQILTREREEMQGARRKAVNQQQTEMRQQESPSRNTTSAPINRTSRTKKNTEVNNTTIVRDKSLENNPLYNAYNPMRIRSPVNRWKGCTRRQARRAEYDRVFGKPLNNNYPSSDTDQSEEYTTEQEDFETVENRYANAEGDSQLWPWPKMRKAHKELKRGMHNPRFTEAERRRRETDPKRAIQNPAIQTARGGQVRAAPEVLERIRRLEDELTRQQQKLKRKEQDEQRWKAKVEILNLKNRLKDKENDSIDEYFTEPENSTIIHTKRHLAMNPRSRRTVVTSQLPEENFNNNCSCSERSCSATKLADERRTNGGQNEQEAQKRAMHEEKAQGRENFINPPTIATATNSEHSIQAPTIESLQLDIPTFEGTNWPTFLNQFENVAEYLQWTPRVKAMQLHHRIRGKAGEAISAVELRHWTYEQLVEHMELRHGKVKSYGDIVIEIMGQTRKPGQALSSWHDQIINITNTANLSESQRQSARFYGFVYGLRGNASLYNRVLSQCKELTINEAFKKAVAYEKDHGSQVSFMYPGSVNMMTTQPSEEVKKVAKENPDRALLAAIKSSQVTESGPLSSFLTEVTGKIEQLGEKFEQRFDRLDIRVGALERQSKSYSGGYNNRGRGGQNNYNNNGNSRNNFNGGYNGRNQGYNDSRGRGGFNGNRGRGGYNNQHNGNQATNDNNSSTNNNNDSGGASTTTRLATGTGNKQE